jgi:predicted naringenin-chalcone synthase
MTEAVRIVQVATELPAHREEASTILTYLEQWMQGQSERDKEKARRIFRNSGVQARHSIIPIEEVFSLKSFAQRNDVFIREMIPLAEKVLKKALEAAAWLPTQVDYLITTSCTGIMIPSLDAYLVNRLKMRGDVLRLPVTEMGCAGGTSGLSYAYELMKSKPGKRAAVLSFESPTSTFQPQDFSFTNIVSAAIFGDGLACTLLSSAPEDVQENQAEIADARMYHFFDEERMMGFDLRENGLHIVLDPGVPLKIEAHFPHIIPPFLADLGWTLQEIDHFVFHPGGKKIIEMVESLVQPMGKDLRHTRHVLSSIGNMSSATVMFVLKACLDQGCRSGQKGIMLSFGPGFSAQQLALEWK